MLAWAAPVPDGLAQFAAECDAELHRRGALTAHRVWEELALRDCIPATWLGDHARRFRRARRRRYAPRTCWDALTFAALAAEVPTLEALAREAAARLAPWSALGSAAATPRAGESGAPGAVLDQHTAFWRVAPRRLDRGSVLVGPVVEAALSGVRRLLSELAGPAAKRRDRGTTLAALRAGLPPSDQAVVSGAWGYPSLANLPRLFTLWQQALAAAARDARAIPDGLIAPGARAGALVSSLPDPFEPLLALLARGCALRDVSSLGLHVYAPTLPTRTVGAHDLAARWRRREG